MCLPFACLGLGVVLPRQDDDRDPPAPTSRGVGAPTHRAAAATRAPHRRHQPQPAAQRNGGYYHRADYEPGSNGAKRSPAPAGAGEAVAQPSWSSKVAVRGGATGYHHHAAAAPDHERY